MLGLTFEWIRRDGCVGMESFIQTFGECAEEYQLHVDALELMKQVAKFLADNPYYAEHFQELASEFVHK